MVAKYFLTQGLFSCPESLNLQSEGFLRALPLVPNMLQAVLLEKGRGGKRGTEEKHENT